MTSPASAPSQAAAPEGALPRVIQGGMGIAVSGWALARAVSRAGQLGVVSATAMDNVIVHRLQDGDPGGHVRRALEHFPFPGVAERVVETYFRPQGREAGQRYRRAPMFTGLGTPESRALGVLGSFVEVWLAREGHAGQVGINLLTKVQVQTLPSLYGAMLAGVDYVLMGAGIPREIPGVLDRLARGESARLRLDVAGEAAGESTFLELDPAQFGAAGQALKRPRFLPIIASNLLATMLIRKATGRIDGFIVEGPTAGGHNAPPRGTATFDELGQPVYGPRDEVDLAQLGALGLPFWLAGGTASPGALRQALEAGAAGIQVGTLFAYCDESGLEPGLRERVLAGLRAGELRVFTDPLASPTGFPFKVVNLPGTLADPAAYEARTRVCDLGYLREAYRTDEGKLRFRCASEPVETYLAKGGALEDTVGRKCLCNALMADIGLGQVSRNGPESPLLTSGDDLLHLGRFLGERTHYSAAEALAYLLGEEKSLQT